MTYQSEEEPASLKDDNFDEHETAPDSNDKSPETQVTKEILDIDVQEEPVQKPPVNNQNKDDESSDSDNGQGQITLF